MSTVTRFTAAALVGLCILGHAATASAFEIQPFVPAETKLLLRAAVRSGITFFSDVNDSNARAICESQPQLLGQANSKNQVLLCNNNGPGRTDADKAQTLRHELIHSAQFCKGRRHGASSALLFPDQEGDHLVIALRELKAPMELYPKSKWASEAEARVLGAVLEEHQIATILQVECGSQPLS